MFNVLLYAQVSQSSNRRRWSALTLGWRACGAGKIESKDGAKQADNLYDLETQLASITNSAGTKSELALDK